MTARELVSALVERGVRLAVRGEILEYEAPAGKIGADDIEALRRMKPSVLAVLRERRALTLPGIERLSLWSLDRVLEVAVPWSDIRLLIAPGCRVARELRAVDLKPGRVWCVCEVLDLLLSGVRPEDARSIAQTRLTFDADLAGVHKEQQ